MRYTNDVAWDLIDTIDLPWPDSDGARILAPLVEAIRQERPHEEIDRLSRTLAPAVWDEAVQRAVRFELLLTRAGVSSYLRTIDKALADLEARGARSMTARAVVDHVASALASDDEETVDPPTGLVDLPAPQPLPEGGESPSQRHGRLRPDER